MRKFLSRFVADDKGATAIEYGLIAAGIAVGIISIVTVVGGDLQGTFQGVADGLNP